MFASRLCINLPVKTVFAFGNTVAIQTMYTRNIIALRSNRLYEHYRLAQWTLIARVCDFAVLRPTGGWLVFSTFETVGPFAHFQLAFDEHQTPHKIKWQRNVLIHKYRKWICHIAHPINYPRRGEFVLATICQYRNTTPITIATQHYLSDYMLHVAWVQCRFLPRKNGFKQICRIIHDGRLPQHQHRQKSPS